LAESIASVAWLILVTATPEPEPSAPPARVVMFADSET